VVGQGAVEVKDGQYFGTHGAGFEHVWVHGWSLIRWSGFIAF
jgi:hypothetical protein